ncbi:MAG: HAD family hydrolase [Phycisphaerales bacterium]
MRHCTLRAALAALAFTCAASADPLPSWRDDGAQARIVAFVEAAINPASPTFVPEAERIAVFDNDGTLWAEQPAYFQLFFALDRVRALAPEHPEWSETEPFKSALAGDMATLAAQGEHGILELVMASHAGMTTDEFAQVVRDWLAAARHPTTGRPYTEMVYRPMLELLDYLRANGFQTWIVSGGGVEFMRVFAEAVYGVPPEQTIGSSIRTTFELRAGEPVIVRLPEIDFINDKAGKPIAIHKVIGRRPVFAAGNSDGDLQMLQWTDAPGDGDFCLLVHHTDGEREWAYDRESHIGRLDAALDAAAQRGWVVVDMEAEWSLVFGAE